MTLVKFKDYSKAERQAMVKKGWAMPDPESGGAFPIADEEDLKDALHRVGTTKHSRRSVIAHIRKAAERLGKTDMLGDKTAPTGKATHGVMVQAPLNMVAKFSQRKVLPNGNILRRGKVYEADPEGAPPRVDMHGIQFPTTPTDLVQMVMTFEERDAEGKLTNPIGFGHPEAPHPLEGKLGHVRNYYMHSPTELGAEVEVPPFIDALLDETAPVSMIFDLETKKPGGLDFVNDPNVVSAAVSASFAKYSKNGSYPGTAVAADGSHTPMGTADNPIMHTHHHPAFGAQPDSLGLHDHRPHAHAGDNNHNHAHESFYAAVSNTGAPGTSTVTFAVQETQEDKANASFARRMRTFWDSLFQSAAEAEAPKAKMAGDDPKNDFENDWQEEHMTGSNGISGETGANLGNDYENNYNDFNRDGKCPECGGDLDGTGTCTACGTKTDANPTPIAAGTGFTWSENAEMSGTPATPTAQNVLMAQLDQANRRALQLEADLNRERAGRIESEAKAFADREMESHRSLPAEQEFLVEMYRQAAADDMVIGAIKMADGTQISRTERLKTMFATRPEHHLTKEQVAMAFNPDVLTAAMETARARELTGVNHQMDQHEKMKLLGMTPKGRNSEVYKAYMAAQAAGAVSRN